MELEQSSVCACCWERLGSRSKALYSANEAIEEQIRTFIFPGYSSTIKHYPDVICSELKTLEWDILNPDRIINLEIKNERRTSNI